jgi:predicted small lipoprotein YifL
VISCVGYSLGRWEKVMPVRVLVLFLLTTVAVTGCGRRGPLEEPPSASTILETGTAPAGAGISPLDPGSGLPAEADASPGAQQPAAPRRFFLDFLL